MHKMRMGFTLAELLISLAVLGVIATFTIPKVLTSSQNENYNAMAKEAAAMVSSALQSYQLYNTGAPTGLAELTPYMNYASIKTGLRGDLYDLAVSGLGSINTHCYDTLTPGGNICIKLANGSLVVLPWDNNARFLFDPDGHITGVNHSVLFDIDSSNGRISNNPNRTPTWFHWENQ